jgi:outer membrane protein assembly factor BamB
MDGYLYAVDQETGKRKVEIQVESADASSPAVVRRSVYFVSSMGALGALDAKRGNIKWVLPTEYERKFEQEPSWISVCGTNHAGCVGPFYFFADSC